MGEGRERPLWQRLVRHPLGRAALVILAVLGAVALVTGILTLLQHGYSVAMAERPGGQGPLGEPQPPGSRFLLGTDSLGRDVFIRLLYGSQISLAVALCAMATSIVLGTTIGLLGGYFEGWVDVVLGWWTETILSLPTILLAIALCAAVPGSSAGLRFLRLMLAIGLVTWTGIARAVRGQTLSLKRREFVEAARAAGCSSGRILWRHILPNVLPTILVLATLAVAHNILLEAGLSYLGLGIDPSIPSWGNMISEGQPYMLSAPWIILPPGLAIMLAVAGFNFLGQALQDLVGYSGKAEG